MVLYLVTAHKTHMDIKTFINKLSAYQGTNVFNPWRDHDPNTEISPEAPEMRRKNLSRYLELRKDARYLFIAEALGYQGGHFSGVAITSERILLGQHKAVSPESVLGKWDYQRTSDANSHLLNATQRAKGFNEPTDTVVWSALQSHGLAAFDVILWNIFPWHPHKQGNLLTNRTPSQPELDVGVEYAKMLLELVPGMKIVAIGQKAADTLARYNIKCTAVRHPSMGGAETFRAQVAQLLAKKD